MTELERMADPLDEAASLTHRTTDAAVSAISAAVNRPLHPDFDGVHCVECGVAIPPGRLATHTDLCVDCKTLEEERAKRLSRTYAPAAPAGWQASWQSGD